MADRRSISIEKTCPAAVSGRIRSPATWLCSRQRRLLELSAIDEPQQQQRMGASWLFPSMKKYPSLARAERFRLDSALPFLSANQTQSSHTNQAVLAVRILLPQAPHYAHDQ
jgi:hypothetical protein